MAELGDALDFGREWAREYLDTQMARISVEPHEEICAFDPGLAPQDPLSVCICRVRPWALRMATYWQLLGPVANELVQAGALPLAIAVVRPVVDALRAEAMVREREGR